MVKPFMLNGPTNNPYPGTVCLPQVPLPAGANVSAGDRATIQVVELAQHGAALYSVSLYPLIYLLFHRKNYPLGKGKEIYGLFQRLTKFLHSASTSSSLSQVTLASPSSTRQTASTRRNSASPKSTQSPPRSPSSMWSPRRRLLPSHSENTAGRAGFRLLLERCGWLCD